MIEDIEHLTAKLEPVALTDCNVLFQVHVPILIMRSPQHVVAGITECVGRGRGESGWIEPPRIVSMCRVQRYAWYAICAATGAVNLAARCGICDGEGLTGLKRGDARQLPPADEFVREAARAAEQHLVLAE